MLMERPHWVTDAVAADGRYILDCDLCSLLAFKTNANLTGRRGAAPMDHDPEQHFWFLELQRPSNKPEKDLKLLINYNY